MLNLREYREPTSRLPDYLPWAALVAPGVVLQKDALLQKTVEFRGPDLASSSAAELRGTVAQLNNTLRRLGSGWGFFMEAQRLRSDHYPASQWKHPAAWLVDSERREAFRAGTHFESRYYFTFVWKMPSGSETKMRALFFDDPGSKAGKPSDALKDLESFEKKVSEVIGMMSHIFPYVSELQGDALLTYLHSTISTNRQPVAMPPCPMYLDALLPDMPFTPGDVPMLGDTFIPTSTIAGFPGDTVPGIFDALNHLEIEYRWVTRFLPLDKEAAKVELEKYRKSWWKKRKGVLALLKEEATKEQAAFVDGSAAAKAADADAALRENGEDLVSFGFLTTTLTVWDPDLQVARGKMARVTRVIQGRGFTMKDETLNSTEAWLGSLPGNVYPNVRRPLVSSLNLAHMMPLSAVWAGSSENLHLKREVGVGTPHVYCATGGSNPFRLNLNVDDVGHTLIVGPTGAGKSTLLNLLELQWLRYPGARVIVFDKGRSARAVTLAVGGVVYEPGYEHAPVAFQPLADIHLPAERVWAERFILNLFRAQKVEESTTLKQAIAGALSEVAADARERRTLTVLHGLLKSQNVGADALLQYVVGGPFGQIFDADSEALEPSFFTLFEMGHLMGYGEECIVPALEYLFHRIERSFDGKPTLLVLDEAWLFLSHSAFSRQLQAWLKTLRKANVYCVFATQEVNDLLNKPELLSTILSACNVKIFLPDEAAQSPEMAERYARFGLSEREVQILGTPALAQKKRDYYYRSTRGRRLFRLDLGPVALAFAGMASPKDQHFMDQMVATVPREEYAAAMLRHQGLNWAADLLKDASTAEELNS